MRSRRSAEADSVGLPLPIWGEGGGEGVTAGAVVESVTPHPAPLPMGEGADRVSLLRRSLTAAGRARHSRRSTLLHAPHREVEMCTTGHMLRGLPVLLATCMLQGSFVSLSVLTLIGPKDVFWTHPVPRRSVCGGYHTHKQWLITTIFRASGKDFWGLSPRSLERGSASIVPKFLALVGAVLSSKRQAPTLNGPNRPFVTGNCLAEWENLSVNTE